MQGSLVNRLFEAARQPAPYVGMPVTICHYSDRSVGIVVAVQAGGKAIEVAPVRATRTDNHGMSDAQSYEYTGPGPDWNGATSRWSLRKNGRWCKVGYAMRQSPGLALGYWDAYYDYSF